MNSTWPLAALFFLLGVSYIAPAALASDDVKIVDVGLQGYYLNAVPTVVRVLALHADSQPATFEFRVHVRSMRNGQIVRVDTFTKAVLLGANEQRVVDVPVFLVLSGIGEQLEIEEADERGKVIARDSITLSFQAPSGLVALLCLEQKVCQEAQSQISFSGSPLDQAAKGKNLKFVTVQYAPEEWWGYAPARTVVLAEPLAQMSQAQRIALEEFVRNGGTLVVLQDHAGDSEFLAPYRAPPSQGAPSIVGRGKVIWIPSLQSNGLGALYSGPGLRRSLVGWQADDSRNNELDWVRSRLTTRFKFPTLLWLFGWLAAYILVAGVGNFIFLRVIDRREWGWVTLPCLSLLFAFAMYFSSASDRPKEFLAEDVTFYWMDENSSIAAVERGERVSSPRRRTLDFSLQGDVVLAGDRNGTDNMLSVNPFENDSQDQLPNHWDVKTGSPVEVSLRLLQWSFRDLEFYGIEHEPGTVRFASAGHLHNGTGKKFSQAIYVDQGALYTLGAVPDGADIGLTDAKKTPLGKVTGARTFGIFGFPSALTEVSQDEINADAQLQRVTGNETAGTDVGFQDGKGISNQPFDLAELVRGWPLRGGHVFDSRSGIFFGLTDEPDPPVSLSGVQFGRKGHSVTVVSFERKP
jgi:hypothetical protein